LQGIAPRKWPARLQWKPKAFAQIPTFYRLFMETDAHGTGGVFLCGGGTRQDPRRKLDELAERKFFTRKPHGFAGSTVAAICYDGCGGFSPPGRCSTPPPACLIRGPQNILRHASCHDSQNAPLLAHLENLARGGRLRKAQQNHRPFGWRRRSDPAASDPVGAKAFAARSGRA